MVLPDLHAPFFDKKVITLIIKICKNIPFDGLIQLGDAIDFYQLSKYDRDPKRKDNIEDDLIKYSLLMNKIMPLLRSNAVWHQLEGNHEDRLRRYIWSKCPELQGMISSIPEYLKFKDMVRKVIWYPYEELKCVIGEMLFHHGVYFNVHTAVNNINKYRRNICTGHTHRFQYATSGNDGVRSITLGCLCDISKTMHRPVPSDWHSCFGIYEFNDKYSQIYPIFIQDNKCIINGQLY